MLRLGEQELARILTKAGINGADKDLTRGGRSLCRLSEKRTDLGEALPLRLASSEFAPLLACHPAPCCDSQSSITTNSRIDLWPWAH